MVDDGLDESDFLDDETEDSLVDDGLDESDSFTKSLIAFLFVSVVLFLLELLTVVFGASESEGEIKDLIATTPTTNTITAITITTIFFHFSIPNIFCLGIVSRSKFTSSLEFLFGGDGETTFLLFPSNISFGIFICLTDFLSKL